MKNAKPLIIAIGIVVVLIALMMILSTTGYAISTGTGNPLVGGGGFSVKCSNVNCKLCSDQQSCVESSCIWDSALTKCIQPAFDASAIVSGVFNAARIPVLDISTKTSGNLPASRITGVLRASQVPNLYINTFSASSSSSPSTAYKSMIGKSPDQVCRDIYHYRGALSAGYRFHITYYSNKAACLKGNVGGDVNMNSYAYFPEPTTLSDFSMKDCLGGMTTVQPGEEPYVINGITYPFRLDSTILVTCYTFA